MAHLSRSQRWGRFINQLSIRTSERQIERLIFNEPQRRIWARIADKIDHLEPIRIICLKARREGISTLVESLLMTFCSSGENVQALITAHQKKPANKIWSMSKLFVTHSPLLKKLATVGNSTITIGRSTLEVATAGSPESERGGDLTAWHASEAAFYPHPEVMTATMQALPQSEKIFSIGVIESTANGMEGDGEDFYDEWCRAEAGDSDWDPVFLAWHTFPDYAKENVRHLEDLDAEEYELRGRFELTDGQLAWRRWAIRNKCKGRVQLFRQEYPATSEEAFIQSGLPFFQPHELLWLNGHLREGMRVVVDTDGATRRATDGYLEIFQPPQPGHTYVIGADSSMGMQDRDDRKEHSRSGACVIDMDTLEQVAEYDAPSAPHVFAKHLVGIGRLYNNALIAPEVQSSGGGGGREVLVYIRDLGYWNLHQWKGDPDKIRRHDAILYGWECLAPESKVLTTDRGWVRADKIGIGESIRGCEEQSERAVPEWRDQEVVDRKEFNAPIIEVVLSDGRTTRVSETHPFWAMRSAGDRWSWIQALDLCPGHFLMTYPSLSATSIARIRSVGEGNVIGLTTDPDHTLIADGIVGHNTNSKTRPRMLARIREVVMEKSAIIRSRRLFKQLTSFGEDDHGHMEALAGRDDLLFAWGIALMSRSENYFKMPSAPADPFVQPDWAAMGIHVLQQESTGDRLRRLLLSSDREPHQRSFLES